MNPILLSHANIFSAPRGCLKHSNFLKVNEPEPTNPSVKKGTSLRKEATAKPYLPIGRQFGVMPKSDYELFNCNNFNIRYWSWNYRGCWHQTCPPMDPR